MPPNKRGTKPPAPAIPPWMTTGLSYGEVATPPVMPSQPRTQARYRSYLPLLSQAQPRLPSARNLAGTTPPGYPYPTYLPLAETGGATAPAQASTGIYRNTLTPARAFGRWGYGINYVLDPANYEQEPGRQYTPPAAAGQGTAPAGEAGGGGGGGRAPRGGTVPAPAGVNPEWYAQFQREHQGQTPEEFYAKTGEGLPHAMADEEWARGFAEMHGRPPNEYEWSHHWFVSRTGATPQMREEWRMRRIARQEAQKATVKTGGKEQRPPVWQPPMIVWR